MKVYLLIVSVFTLLGACTVDKSGKINDLELEQVFGDENWQSVNEYQLRVYYFLAPECPLCQNYAKSMRELQSEYKHVKFIGIFPGMEYSKEEIRQYLFKFRLDFDAFLDPEFKLTDMMGAEITPEAFLVDDRGEILYSGAIDNWAISLGQKRTVITQKYLENAIEALASNSEIDPEKSKAVGCFIQ